MTIRSGARRLLAFGSVPAAGLMLAAFGQQPMEVGPPPSRVLVAPVAVAEGADPAALEAAVPALIAEAITGERTYTASLARDLDPDTLEALGLETSGVTRPALADPKAPDLLREHGYVRVMLLPSIEKGTAGAAPLRLVVKWRDLVTGEEGSVSAEARDAADLIDASGRAAAAAQEAFSASFKPARATKSPPAAPPPLSETTSRSAAAVAAWARAGDAWNRGDVPAAEAALQEALAADAGFGRASVDLGWIRLAQGRAKEAASLARGATKAKRLSGGARALAEIIVTASEEAPPALEALSRRLDNEAPSAPWGALAAGMARNINGDHVRAVSAVDQILLHRPNDPAIVYHAGMAALGAGDIYEAHLMIERAARMWPSHDRIQLDLAEVRLRGQDLDGAEQALEAWRDRYVAGTAPVWGGSWTIDDPPPTVRAVEVQVLKGSVTKAIERLEKEDSLLEAAGAPASDRVPVLYALHDLQTQLAFGEDTVRQRWLDAARESFRRLKEVMPSEDQAARPWILGGLEGLLRVRERRLPEAREIRERIVAASSQPGYDPSAEIKIELAITLSEGDAENHFEACRRGVQVRGSLEDHYFLGQAFALAQKWGDVEKSYQAMADRIEAWSAARRHDAILWSPQTSLLTPLIYTLGAEAAYYAGEVNLSHARYGVFLSYFKKPDKPLLPYFEEAIDRGAKPAW